MSDDIRKDLKKLALRTETRLAESLLKWKHRKEGKEPPEEERVRRDSERVAERANRVLSERGKRVWEELKKAYRASGEEEDGKD
jgi:hypothetical protein